MKDISLRAITAGFIAVLFKDLFDYVYMSLGFQGASMIKIAAGTFVSPDNVSAVPGLIIGTVAHYTVGGLIGLIFFIYILLSSPSYNLVKGIFFGIVIWLFLAGMLLNFGISSFVPFNPSSKIMLLFDHMIFGAVLGFLMPRLVLLRSENKLSIFPSISPAFKPKKNND